MISDQFVTGLVEWSKNTNTYSFKIIFFILFFFIEASQDSIVVHRKIAEERILCAKIENANVQITLLKLICLVCPVKFSFSMQ